MCSGVCQELFIIYLHEEKDWTTKYGRDSVMILYLMKVKFNNYRYLYFTFVLKHKSIEMQIFSCKIFNILLFFLVNVVYDIFLLAICVQLESVPSTLEPGKGRKK